MAIPVAVVGGAAVVAAAGVAIRGVRKVRRRRRRERAWAAADYPPRGNSRLDARERSETFSADGEFTMGEVKQRLHGWNG